MHWTQVSKGIAMAGLIVFIACSSDQQTKDAEEPVSENNTSQPQEAVQQKAPDELSFPIDSVAGRTLLEDYLTMKDALVDGNTASASNLAKSMKTTMATVTSKGKPVEYFMASLSSFLKANDLEAQRVAFEKISQQMYALAAENQWGITLYKQYCPMAFDNEGAYWLSAEEEIMNPYFGDQMLHCGTVQETLAAK